MNKVHCYTIDLTQCDKSSRVAATSEVRGHNIANSEVGAGTADNCFRKNTLE